MKMNHKKQMLATIRVIMDVRKPIFSMIIDTTFVYSQRVIHHATSNLQAADAATVLHSGADASSE